jgi:hypothetical protein
MPTTISYNFDPGTEVFVVTGDHTISEGKVLEVRAFKYLEKTLLTEQITDAIKYVIGLNDGKSIVTNDEGIVFPNFEDAKNHLI